MEGAAATGRNSRATHPLFSNIGYGRANEKKRIKPNRGKETISQKKK